MPVPFPPFEIDEPCFVMGEYLKYRQREPGALEPLENQVSSVNRYFLFTYIFLGVGDRYERPINEPGEQSVSEVHRFRDSWNCP